LKKVVAERYWSQQFNPTLSQSSQQRTIEKTKAEIAAEKGFQTNFKENGKDTYLSVKLTQGRRPTMQKRNGSSARLGIE
jgi:hypothetical protein